MEDSTASPQRDSDAAPSPDPEVFSVRLLLTPEEEASLSAEIERLQAVSVVCRFVGTRPSRGELRDLLQARLLADVGKILDVQFLGRGHYQIEFESPQSVAQVLAMSPLDIRGARAFFCPWSHGFDPAAATEQDGARTSGQQLRVPEHVLLDEGLAEAVERIWEAALASEEDVASQCAAGISELSRCMHETALARPLSDLGLDNSEVPEGVDYSAAQERDELSPEVLQARDMAHQVWNRWSQEKSLKSGWKDRGNRNSQNLPKCLHRVSRKEMELVFLGTGSSQPSKHRNVTGIYIHLFKKGGVMLDCGEGTFAQLKRRYGAKGADDLLLGLKCIWISHLHADHFTGILRILSARKALLQAQSIYESILVIGPKKLKSFLDSYGKIENLGMEFLDCSQTTLEVQRWADAETAEDGVAHKKEGLINWSTRCSSERNGMQHIWKQPGYHIQQGVDIEGRKRLRAVLDRLGLKDLYSVPVIHCPNAFAVVLEAQGKKVNKNATKPGWKLVFSGDTRPCQALVEAAKNATILIHEATFDDDLIAEAVKKNHSITLEAMKVGIDAGVYRIFLTHFSQRYPTIPYFDNQFKDRACMAFDMMSVNLADLPIVPEFLPALQMLFRDRSDAEEETECTHALSV
ncbi:hypothetical protein L7F22_026118 [Adiantum nelumboides]|nr:hypothetical protein [Adiantum nelumboides]